MQITREAWDDVRDVAWPHHRLTGLEAFVAPSEIEGEVIALRLIDRSVDFVVEPETRRILESRGPLGEHPQVFTANARPPGDEGRPRKPFYTLAEGVELPG